MKLSCVILLLTSISAIASPLHTSQESPHTPPIKVRDTLSTTETQPESFPKIPPATISSLFKKGTNGIHPKRNQSEGDPNEIDLYTFAALEHSTSPSYQDTTSIYATFNVPDINYHLSSSTQDGSYSQYIIVELDGSDYVHQCGILQRVQRASGKNIFFVTGVHAWWNTTVLSEKLREPPPRESFDFKAGETIMAYVVTQKLLKQTLATCYLKNVNTNQQVNWTISAPGSYSVPQWKAARWGVAQEASKGFPTPYFQNITFKDLRVSNDYGVLTTPGEVTGVYNWLEEDTTAMEVIDGAAYRVYWTENPRVKTIY
ncbi:hypothetical protein GLAREA_12110 [Glarea lozoyensis ATCC 20868]|uniref:Concanavalin A-like lectins/glucanase n=1 Tax=Glarea lozoyensis (strain ATCC 20868 / MF5171) TaxID=1116229 RepID=S3E0G0_GLAL2|nr:uncharacterized protein GLAREA_12110 [Glarea lozoyensis ATCC 20868]EPE32028.1 hypothetical protein GLAREA_12110 [Glarea lozoyensis ATCC 20868]